MRVIPGERVTACNNKTYWTTVSCLMLQIWCLELTLLKILEKDERDSVTDPSLGGHFNHHFNLHSFCHHQHVIVAVISTVEEEITQSTDRCSKIWSRSFAPDMFYGLALLFHKGPTPNSVWFPPAASVNVLWKRGGKTKLFSTLAYFSIRYRILTHIESMLE